jgi:hypothetical protein
MNTNYLTKLLCLALSSGLITTRLFAVEPTPASKPPPVPAYTLVFSDDFSTDPNSNGKWKIFRRQNVLTKEGYWNSTEQDWYLTTQSPNLATAAFANYELTAKTWKVDFRYRVDNGPMGADGFCLMFYKDKGAYGGPHGIPDSGDYKAFQTRMSKNNNEDNPVPGYGLQFDTWDNYGCDPQQVNFVGIIKDKMCDSSLVDRPFAKIEDDVWHSVEFTYSNGRCSCTIDNSTVMGFSLSDADYTYTGIGFGAGTGSYTSNQIIDDVQIWVAD